MRDRKSGTLKIRIIDGGHHEYLLGYFSFCRCHIRTTDGIFVELSILAPVYYTTGKAHN